MSIEIQTEEQAGPYPRWPRKVQELQEMMDVRWEVADDSSYISATLPLQHRRFHESNITFLPLAAKDDSGRVWTSILAGRDGRPGFVKSPNPRLLQVVAEPPEGDPAWRTLPHGAEKSVAGVGVETTTRRRNKVGGQADIEWRGKELHLDISVTEALGNCPKYVSTRPLLPLPFPSSSPSLSLQNLEMREEEALPSAVVEQILASDTIWLGTSYIPPSGDSTYPAHLGANHRGGRPGWVRVTADRTALVIPDYSGNRHFTSLANILTDAHVGVTFVDFVSGDVLYLTGMATNLIGEEATKLMPRAGGIVTLVKATGYTLVKDALPFRQPAGVQQPSPYSPPVRYLADEQGTITSLPDVKARLTTVDYHTDDLATFTFETSAPVKVTAGQYAVLDTTPVIGEKTYSHMAARGQEATLNDDGVRTWTIAVPPTAESPNTFSLTIRKVEAGRVSPRLFAFGTYMLQAKAKGAGFIPKMELPLQGVGGTFILPSPPQDLLLIAGGIGITPYLAFLGQLAQDFANSAKIQLLVSTREPEITFDLIKRSLAGRSLPNLSVSLFSSASDTSFDPKSDVTVSQHQGRISAEAVKEAVQTLTDAKVYVCGPPAFEASAQSHLEAAGITAYEHEAFNY